MEEKEVKKSISEKELSNASHIFARTINLLMEENDGIIVDVTPDVEFDEDVKKVIVFKHQNMIHIQRFDQDLEEGSLITLEIDENLPQE